MIPRAALPLVAALLVSVGVMADDTVVEVIGLNHRPAEDVAAILEPLAGPGGVVTAARGKLLVRATPAALAQIRKALAEIDVPARPLWITVKQSLDRSSTGSGADVSGGVTVGGNTRVTESTSAGTPAGVTVERHARRSTVTGAFGQGSAQESSEGTQRLQVLEGGRAFIRVGRTVPVAQATIVEAPSGPVAVAGTAYPEADEGFYVIPRLSGDLVTLEVETAADRVDYSGTMNVQRLRTTVSGRLGEWISLGSASRTEEGRESGVLATGRRQVSEERSVLLKVESAP